MRCWYTLQLPWTGTKTCHLVPNRNGAGRLDSKKQFRIQ